MALSQPLIAIVEDENSVRVALGRLLRAAGFGTDGYASGEEFLAALVRQEPDCLLLDFHLPGMNGLAVQAHLRLNGVNVPVVFITATAGAEARAQALRGGAVTWLNKPVDELALLDAIRLALTQRS